MKKMLLFLVIFASNYYTLSACERRLEEVNTTAELRSMYTELLKAPLDSDCLGRTRLLLKVQSRAELLNLIESDTLLSLSDWSRAIEELIKQVTLATTLDTLHALHQRELQLCERLIPISDDMEEMTQLLYQATIELRRQHFAQAYVKHARAITEEQELPERSIAQEQQQEPSPKRSRSTTPEIPQRVPLSQAQLAELSRQKSQ